MATRRIFLARHGNRQDFVDPAWVASAAEPYDPPLSADGVDQARRLGLRLENEGITSVVASPFLRTVQTAHHANEALQVPIYLEPGFGEFLPARWFNRMPRLRELELLRTEYPTLGEGYVATGVQCYPETAEQLIERTQRALTRLLDSLPGTLLVVSHAASVCAMALIDPAIESVECPLCALFCLEHDDSRWRLSLDCEVTHVGGRLETYRFP
jgi:broad specificity phosphatase PhoE